LIEQRRVRKRTTARPTLTRFAGWALALSPALSAFGQTQVTSTNLLKPHQKFTLEPAPQAPSSFSPDSGQSPVEPPIWSEEELQLRLKSVSPTEPPPLVPRQFNPDPGASAGRKLEYAPEFRYLEETGKEPVPPELDLPRDRVRRSELEYVAPQGETPEVLEVPPGLELPRRRTRYNETIDYDFRSSDLPVGTRPEDFPPYMFPQRDRWRIGFAPWRRYTQGNAETPYETPMPYLWHPYKQSVLKGDVPIIGQDIFLNLTASSTTEFEARRLPTPSGVSAARPDSSEFFGRGEQFGVQQYLGFTIDLFKGETAFKPVKWALHLQPVLNVNFVNARETGVVSPDPRGSDRRTQSDTPIFVTDPQKLENLLHRADDDLAGRAHTTRTRDYLALQEAFVEAHITDLSDNYDFLAVRGGNQVFNSDFRGFIFNDVNLGARIFGNAANNRYQYNLAVFDLREKDTNSELNTFDDRDQTILVANVYRQDFLWHGYTAQASFHANWDDGALHYDRNGNVARPEPLGALKEHSVNSYYLGWTGDGHIGRLNLSHAFYQVFGHDQYNGLAGQPVDINAQMVALEASFDRDWVRYKASFFYASGDSNADDNKAHGFDSIIDNPNFTGGPFSYYVRQGFNLGGTAVGLKQRSSLLPNVRSSKTEGQSNFVNPGLFLFGIGTEIDVTPKLRNFININYLRFAETNPIETALLMNDIDNEIGLDLSIGFQYRPFLTDNVIISTGFGTLLPGAGYRDIYRRIQDPVPGVPTHGAAGSVDHFLYSGILVLTLTF
jgi:hypothetical protein